MKLHFIAIGGSAMHNLAIALKKKGFDVSGSDDEIFEPARGRLLKYGILPREIGWFPEKVVPGLEAVILGMHAKNDNPELIRARELGLRIFSYPEYLFEQSRSKTRVVVAGSHGKTTITSMILHALHFSGIDTDYMVGAQLEGFEIMVRISVEARFMVLEGDEYLSSPLDPRPKFHLYRPHIALLSGIAWDHMNVFPTFGNYVDQFRRFIELIEPGGTLIYCASDPVVAELASSAREDIRRIAYSAPEYSVDRGKTYLHLQDRKIPLRVFGRHNMENLEGARLVCREMGLEGDSFFNSLPSFSGASKRLQLLGESPETSVFKDFAHSPSKLNATIRAVKEQYPDRSLVACLELHTYSSLNKDFLPEYKDCMAMADIPAVYFSPHALALKRLPMLDAEDIKIAFNDQRLQVFTEPAAMQRFILEQDFAKKNLLLMSSGNFDGLDLEEISLKVLNP